MSKLYNEPHHLREGEHRHFAASEVSSRQREGQGHLGVTFFLTPRWFTGARESQPLDIRGTHVFNYSVWVKVAKLDSIVGKLLSYISLCLGSICKNSTFSKKILFDLIFYKYAENMNHVDFIGVLPTHHFLAKAPSFNGIFPLQQCKFSGGYGCCRWPTHYWGSRSFWAVSWRPLLSAGRAANVWPFTVDSSECFEISFRTI